MPTPANSRVNLDLLVHDNDALDRDRTNPTVLHRLDEVGKHARIFNKFDKRDQPQRDRYDPDKLLYRVVGRRSIDRIDEVVEKLVFLFDPTAEHVLHMCQRTLI